MTEEIIRRDEEGMEVQAQDLALPVCVRVKDDLPRVLATYPIITSDKPSNTKYPKGLRECKWKQLQDTVTYFSEIKAAGTLQVSHSTSTLKSREE